MQNNKETETIKIHHNNNGKAVAYSVKDKDGRQYVICL